MAKTYIDTVKYAIKANFEINGIVEKPDIVGAVFGQTEGLLGDELDLRELQKNGRIGRIEVDAQVRGGRTVGMIHIPSSLDMVETSILAASLEIVDRVGPCDAKIAVTRIEDSRNLKRKQVLDRAKNLLKALLTNEIPESKELSELVRDEVKVSGVGVYGTDRLPAGPSVASSDSIIMVEGRADVICLLKNNINNVVAIGGAKVGRTTIELGRQKEVTAFLDGDRGGDIILRELLNATEIDFVARAPPGKEVEELGRKEIIKALRRRVPVEQVNGYNQMVEQRRRAEETGGRERRFERPGSREPVRAAPTAAPTRAPVALAAPAPTQAPVPAVTEPEARPEAPAPTPTPSPAPKPDSPKALELKSVLKELEGSLKARLLDTEGKALAEMPIREIMRVLGEAREVNAVVLDGIVTQRLVDLAEEKHAQFVVGLRSGNISRKPSGLEIVLSESIQQAG